MKANKYMKLGNIVLVIIAVLIVLTAGFIWIYVNEKANQEGEQVSSLNDIKDKLNEYSDNTVINIDNALTGDITTSSTNSEPEIVLFKGMELNTKVGIKTIKGFYHEEISADDMEKYVVTYYNYEKFAFKSKGIGAVPTDFDKMTIPLPLEGVGKVAISDNYNAIVRDVELSNAIPQVVLDSNVGLDSYEYTKVLSADLDGNSTIEYVIVFVNKTKGNSKITLFDSRGSKVADLVILEKAGWESYTSEPVYLSIDNIEILDIDNDKCMEMLIEIPTASTVAQKSAAPVDPNVPVAPVTTKKISETKIDVLKYKNDLIEGETNFNIIIETPTV